MLDEFVHTHRSAILDRTRAKVAERTAPRPTKEELRDGVPLFLDQLIAALGRTNGSTAEISESAARHGADMLRFGFTVGLVVHTYGNICQAVTELALESAAALTTDDVHTLNRCLDDAIAGAVTAYSAGRDHSLATQGTERLAGLAHEIRNLLHAGMLAFASIEKGSVGVSGSTGALLRRCLQGLGAVVERSMAEARLELELQKRELVRVAELIEEIGIAAAFEADDYGHHLVVDPVEFGLVVDADPQILTAAVGNLLRNAFKFTRPHTKVSLTTRATADRVVIEVADECGGLVDSDGEALFRVFERRGENRTGLGLGLSISRRGVEANGGQLRVRDLPGTGCVFSVDLPRLPPSSV